MYESQNFNDINSKFIKQQREDVKMIYKRTLSVIMIIMMLAISCASADIGDEPLSPNGDEITADMIGGVTADEPTDISEETEENAENEENPLPNGEEISLFGSDDSASVFAADDENSETLEVWHHGMELEGGAEDAENARLYDATTKYGWGVASQSKTSFIKCFNTSNASKKLNITGYDYVNSWIYNPEIKKDEKGVTCKLNVMLITGNSAENASDNRYCFYYRLPMDWTGWKLVSLPLSKFTANRDAKKEYGVFKMGFQAGGYSTSWPEESNYICIDRLWMSKTAPVAAALTVDSVSVENYAGFVDPSLDGSNTYTVTFSSDIAEATVTVKRDGTEVTDGYSLAFDGKQLKVVFDSQLGDATYNIGISRAADIYGNMMSGMAEYCFTVGSHPTIFKFASSSIADGAADVSTDLGGSRTMEFSFNNPVDINSAADNVSVEKNGFAIFGGYSFSAADGRLVLTFDAALDSGAHYTVSINGGLCDIYGQTVEKEVSISFDTAAEQTVSQVNIFRADSDEDIANMQSNDGSGVNVITDNTNLYDRTLKLDMPITPSQRFFRFPMGAVDTSVQKYLNAWIYSPKKTSFGLNFCFFATGTTAYMRQSLKIDWSGWRLVSFPLAGFEIKNGAEWENIYEFRISANGWTAYAAPWTEEGYICVDKMFLTQDAPANSLNITAVNPAENYSAMPRKGAIMTFAFSDDIDSADSSSMSLYKDGAQVNADIRVWHSGNKVYVVTDSVLEPGDYSLKLGGVSSVSGAKPADVTEYKFTVSGDGICVHDISLTKDGAALDSLPSYGSTAYANAKIISNESERVFLTVAMYNKRGSLVSIEKYEHTLAIGDNDISNEFLVADGTAIIKTFVTDGSGIKGDYAVLGKAKEGDGKMVSLGESAGGMTSPSAELKNGVLTVSGKYDSYGPVCVTITDGVGSLIFEVPLSCTDDGSYTYSCAMADMQSGGYTVSVSAADGSAQTVLNVVSADDMAACLAKVNSAASAADISAAIAPYKGYFGLNGESADMAASVAAILYENRPYVSFDGLDKAIGSYKTVISGLSGKLWSELTEYINKNHKVLLNDSAAYTYWASLDDRGKNIINQSAAAALPTDDIAAFRQKFDSAVTNYKNPSQTPGGGGGGSSSKGGGISGTGYTADSSAVQAPTYKFGDISGFEWAQESIYALADSGVISKPEDGLFRPDDRVTREEFIKILVAADGIRLDATESGFADSTADAWYDKYLSAAKREGIAAGRDDGTFGVGLPITRQDAAVFIYRLTAAAPINGDVFADDGDIADYAKQAVYTMRALGITAGFPDGTFLPNSGLTRAEAAVMTARLMKIGGR